MSKEWFAVDKEGLGQMFANFPPERMVMELVQNCWDTDAKKCHVGIEHDKNYTYLEVEDDHPDGFKNIKDAYTLFGCTDKRTDPTKRGRFNFGEKIVLARAKEATITTTKGCIKFTKSGRQDSKTATEFGSVVDVTFPKWTDQEIKQAMSVLSSLYVPRNIDFKINGTALVHQPPVKSSIVSMATEFVKKVDGHDVMTRTKRKTRIDFHLKRGEKANLCEMGLPVCEIDGKYDVDVMQKIPLSQDRTLVPQTFLQDIYAEMLVAFQDELEPGDLGDSHIRTAMEDERVDADTAAKLFKLQFGDNAVIQSHDADSDQEAARNGATIVSSRTFGSSVNAKLRDGGVNTAKEVYCRNKTELTAGGQLPSGYKEVKNSPQRDKLEAYTKMLCSQLYSETIIVKFAQWMGTTTMAAYTPYSLFEPGNSVTYNVMKITHDMMNKPISKCTALVLHELAHCMGRGHDGVYDHEFERLVDIHTRLLVMRPELYKEFEPELFNG